MIKLCHHSKKEGGKKDYQEENEKKEFISIVLAAAMAVSIAGCGPAPESTSNGENTQAEGENSKAPEGMTTAEVWTGGLARFECVEKMIDQYNQNNKDDITI